MTRQLNAMWHPGLDPVSKTKGVDINGKKNQGNSNKVWSLLNSDVLTVFWVFCFASVLDFGFYKCTMVI